MPIHASATLYITPLLQVRHLELPGREDLRKLQLLREEQGELSAGDESRLRRLQRVRLKSLL